MKLTYVVVFEKGPNNYSAYIPDLPGCVSVGRTWEEMHWMIREAITGHLEAMYEDGDPIPSAANVGGTGSLSTYRSQSPTTIPKH